MPGVASETMGREGQARAKRQREERDGERALLGMLEGRIGAGAGVGGSARRPSTNTVEGAAMDVVSRARAQVASGSGKRRNASDEEEKVGDKASDEEAAEGSVVGGGNNDAGRRRYTTQMIRCLGFDPTSKGLSRATDGSKSASKVGFAKQLNEQS